MARVWKVKSLSRSIKGRGTRTTRCHPSGQELTHEHNKSVGLGCVISRAWWMAHGLVIYTFPTFLPNPPTPVSPPPVSFLFLWKSSLVPEALQQNSRWGKKEAENKACVLFRSFSRCVWHPPCRRASRSTVRFPLQSLLELSRLASQNAPRCRDESRWCDFEIGDGLPGAIPWRACRRVLYISIQPWTSVFEIPKAVSERTAAHSAFQQLLQQHNWELDGLCRRAKPSYPGQGHGEGFSHPSSAHHFHMRCWSPMTLRSVLKSPGRSHKPVHDNMFSFAVEQDHTGHCAANTALEGRSVSGS